MKKRFVLCLWLVLLVMLSGCSSISNMSFYRDYVTNDADKQKREILLCEKPSYGLDGVAELLCTRGGAIYRYRGDTHQWYLQYQGGNGSASKDFWLQVDRPILFESRNRAEVVRNEQLVDLMQIRQPVRRQSHSAPTSKKNETPKLLMNTQTSTAKTQPVNSQEKVAKKEVEQQKNSKLQSSQTTVVPVTAQEKALSAQKKALAAQEEAILAKKQAITAQEKAIDAKIRAINAQERATKAQRAALDEQEKITMIRQQKQSNSSVQPKVSATTDSKAQKKANNSFQKSQKPVKLAQVPNSDHKLTSPAKAQSAQKSSNTQKQKEKKAEKQATKSQKTQPVQK